MKDKSLFDVLKMKQMTELIMLAKLIKQKMC